MAAKGNPAVYRAVTERALNLAADGVAALYQSVTKRALDLTADEVATLYRSATERALNLAADEVATLYWSATERAPNLTEDVAALYQSATKRALDLTADEVAAFYRSATERALDLTADEVAAFYRSATERALDLTADEVAALSPIGLELAPENATSVADGGKTMGQPTMEPASRDSLAQLKLMGALLRLDALQPDGFTDKQLAEAARVEFETARSFLRKGQRFADVIPDAKAPATSSSGRGRPADLYQLVPVRRADLIERLATIRQELDRAEGVAEPSRAQLFAPLETLEDTVSELEGGSDTADEWRDRLHEAQLEFTSAMADCRVLRSRKAPEATAFSKRITELQDRLVLLERRGPPSAKTAADQGFEIEIERWEKAGHRDVAVRVTAASLRISVAGHVATRNLAPWLNSVRESAPLAAYPLALWLTKSWWRLRWEPAALGLAKPSWRVAHELAYAADKGFEWPPLVIGSEGEGLFAVCVPEEQQSSSGFRYLDSFRASIAGWEFECAVDKFIEQTIARLNGPDDSELCMLWNKLVQDRADSKRTSYRRLEALLGCDPDEAPPELIRAVEGFTENVDPLAVDELVSAFGASREDDLNGLVVKTRGIIQQKAGVCGRMLRSLPRATLHGVEAIKGQPWEIGKRLASECRSALGLGLEPISNEKLGDLLGLTSAQLSDEGITIAKGLPFGIAIYDADDDGTNFMFRRSATEGRRFEAARFIADAHLSPLESTWMLETDTKTARQKAQRAFAAEFLMPFDGLYDSVGNDFSDESLESAACRYGVSPVAAQLQLQNNKGRILQAV